MGTAREPPPESRPVWPVSQLTTKGNLLIRDTPPVGMYVLNMFCMKGSRL